MRIALGFACLLTMCASGFAQTLGEIAGEVKDSSGASVPGATIIVTNTETNGVRTASTNDAGIYSFPALLPGMYNVRAERAGFRAAVRSQVELQVQQTARVDFTMQVGEATQTVDVTAAAAILNTDDATVGTVIETRRILDLPLNGRNFLQLVALSPNVTSGFAAPGQAAGRQGGTRATQNFSIMGQRGTYNYYSLDGVNNTDVNFNLYVVLPSVDALQEFKVQSGIYPAEFGREAGQVNVSTKPGTNHYHGALYEFFRNDRLDAKQYDFTGTQPPKNPFKWNQYGFTLGGPIWIPKVFNGKNRLFFMANYEGFKVRQANNLIYTVPTIAMRGGDFSSLLPANQLYDPRTKQTIGGKVTGTPFPGNIIPASAFNPVSLKLLEFLPTPNVNTLALSNNYQIAAQNPINKEQFNMRVDFNESANSTWFGRYSWTSEDTLQQAERLNGTTVVTSADQAVISNARVLSPTKVNEFRFGATLFRNDSGIELAGKRNVVNELGIPGLTNANPLTWGIPRLTAFTDISTFGNDSSNPFILRDTAFQVIDNFSWTKGKHSLRFGGEIRRDRYNQAGNEFSRGSFEFNGKATNNPASNTGGESIADFLLGYCSKCEAAVALAFAQFRATSQYYYVDDTWRVRPKLTITAGLRYEYSPPWYDRSQNIINAYTPYYSNTANVADINLHPVLVREGTGDFYQGKAIRFPAPDQVARDGRLGKALVNPNYHDFAPRLGIAYSPSSRLTVRTGFGIFYSQDSANSRFDLARNFAGRATVNADPGVPNVTYQNFLGAAGPTITLPKGGLVLGVKPHLPTAYALQYLLNVQYQLDSKTVIELGYDANQSRHIAGLQNLNPAIPGATGSISSRSPFPEFGIVQTVEAEGFGKYNAFSAKATRRLTAGLSYLASYTWSKALDNTSGIRGTANDIIPQDSRCLRCEYGYSAFNIPNRFVTSVLYELPFGTGKPYLSTGRLLNEVAGGWQLGSIVTWQSGRAINVNAGSDIPGTGGYGEPRLNATGVSPNLPSDQRSLNQWFNPAAFALPAPGTFGNFSRNRLQGPSTIDWDFSAFKNFRITEGQKLELRFESFNFLNHPTWGDPNANWGSSSPTKPGANFLKISTTAYPMRQMQLALKYVF